MKTTRAKLFEKLIEIQKEYGASMGLSSPWIELRHFTDKLIESGLVEIEEEPKEFWVVWGAYQACDYCFKSEQEAIDFQNRNKPSVTNRKQLIPVDQCRKYEKMWNEMKKHVNNFVPESTFSKGNILGIMQGFEQLEKGTK